MISAAGFCAALDGAGVRLVTGVPCSYFAGPLQLLERDPGRYVPAANEGAALAIAAGAELAGRRSAVLIQNSGFGNLLNPLTSLLMTFDLPVLVFMSLRGWPDPALDEPQHAVMGRTSQGLLAALGLPYWVLAPDEDHLAEVLAVADAARRGGQPAFVLVPKAVIEPAGPEPAVPAPFGRREALSVILPHLTGALVFTTTGYVSRELYGLADHPTTFYMQGSMGHALALGVGAALAQPSRRVVVIDGDGAVLMHLGTCVTAGAFGSGGLVHVVLDNGAYESTGGQRTTSSTVDWQALGAAAGYTSTAVTDSAAGLSGALGGLPDRQGPHLVVARIDATPGVLPPRVTSGLSPAELRHRFQRAVSGGAG
ncbi:phosphonopyruvate decarboxylase [Dactylosporangium siamense]|uniref:Thiamine pyrophosphate enzyme n=1 Tax=Dactylosporangium siamense TaxID=685454 RepID=A0A919UC13_9ACTN|nr:phosphonopyruvate decarboxylase [Dactylosporangium siamense]GIG45208.1 thiamine pyrophosphate enzyme [Dactylosporangium siamense]